MVDGGTEVDEPEPVDDVPAVVVVVEGSVVDPVALVVAPAKMIGASTRRGASGRSLTWASAALTICQVKVEAIRATTNHAPTRLHLLMRSLSQVPSGMPSTIGQGFLKGEG